MPASRWRSSIGGVLAAGLFALCGSAALAAPPGPFPVHHGVNIAGPYVRTVTFPFPQAGGQVSDYLTFAKAPASYSPAELKAMGFDFVRFAVNPVPLLENPQPIRAKLLAETEAGFEPYLSHGIRVIYDLHFWAPHPLYTNPAVTSGSPAVFGAYKAMVSDIAARLAKYPTGQVALELLNEPNNTVCSAPRWLQLQGELIRAVRQVAPRLPILVTGCNDLLDATAAINASNTDLRDPNLVFTFHFYDAVLFTEQGQNVGNYAYLRGIPYPVNTGSEASARDQTNAAIDAAHLPFTASVSAKLWAAKQIHWYFNNNWGRAYIDKRLDFMAQWARSNGVSPSRLIIGEFAAVNEFPTDTPAHLKGRLAWDNDVKAAAEARGMAWAFWNLPPTRTQIFR